MATSSNNAYVLSLVALGFFLATAFLYVFGLGIVGFFDVLEAQTAQISLQADGLGQALINPTLNGVAHLGSTPLVHGLQYLSYSFFGETVFAARLPSALAALLLVFMLYNSFWLLTQSRRYALLAAVVVALNPALLIAARLATPDAVFILLTISATMMLIGNIYHSERSFLRLFVAGLIMGFGFLSGGVWAFVLPFFVAFALALLKNHRGYNFNSLAPFSVLISSFLALFPWLIAVIKTHGTEGFLDVLYSVSGIAAFQMTMPDVTWWHLPLFLAVLLLPWSFFALPAVWPNLRRFFMLIDAPDPRQSLPALSLVWLVFGGGLLIATGVFSLESQWLFSPLTFVLWLSVPVALLAADFLDRLPQVGLGVHWLAGLFVLALAVSTCFFWLPQMADILLGAASYSGLHQAAGSLGFPLQVVDPFWQGVLGVKTDWGLAPMVVGALLLVTILMGGYLMRHGAMEGALFMFVGVWFALFIGVQGLSEHVYDHLQQPLKWMSVKIKKENEANPARVVLYGIERPSVSYVSGAPYRFAGQAEAVFRSTHLPLFVITDIHHFELLKPHVPAGASHECFGGYCLVEVYK